MRRFEDGDVAIRLLARKRLDHGWDHGSHHSGGCCIRHIADEKLKRAMAICATERCGGLKMSMTARELGSALDHIRSQRERLRREFDLALHKLDSDQKWLMTKYDVDRISSVSAPSPTCPHDSDEMWKATDAGMCPLCQKAEIELLQAELAQYKKVCCDQAGLDDEIERFQEWNRLRANDIITLGQQVGKLEADIERLRADALGLHKAYLRLRGLIPGAFNTPHAPTPEQVWDTTENALRRALEQKP